MAIPYMDRNRILEMIAQAAYGGYGYQPIFDGNYPEYPYPEDGGIGRLPTDVPNLPLPEDPIPDPPPANTPGRSVPTDRQPLTETRAGSTGRPIDRSLPAPSRTPISRPTGPGPGRPIETAPQEPPPELPVQPGTIEILPGIRIPIGNLAGQINQYLAGRPNMPGANAVLSRSGVPTVREQLIRNFGIIPRNV